MIFQYNVPEILSLAGMAVALFWSAGRIDWCPTWLKDFPDCIAQNRASYLSGEHLLRHGITLPD